MFTAPLRSNKRGTGDRKHRSPIVAHVRFRGNMFTEPLPSNVIFRLSGVMSQYYWRMDIFGTPLLLHLKIIYRIGNYDIHHDIEKCQNCFTLDVDTASLSNEYMF
jgi:hypothetical protein